MLKRKLGYSRKYDNAPMPHMQMYDPKGLAFHAGALPGYPASHGCVRLPAKFAERLYGLTAIGTKVIIEG
jgi:lipoprotein-anchoring transpeptidase ErfK/SrfK